MPGGDYCAATNCFNSVKNCNLSFFRFPKDPDRCRIWVINTGRVEKLLPKTSQQLYGYRLCSDHFNDSQFMNPAKKNRLIHDAVPTVFPNYPSLKESREKFKKKNQANPSISEKNLMKGGTNGHKDPPVNVSDPTRSSIFQQQVHQTDVKPDPEGVNTSVESACPITLYASSCMPTSTSMSEEEQIQIHGTNPDGPVVIKTEPEDGWSPVDQTPELSTDFKDSETTNGQMITSSAVKNEPTSPLPESVNNELVKIEKPNLDSEPSSPGSYMDNIIKSVTENTSRKRSNSTKNGDNSKKPPKDTTPGDDSPKEPPKPRKHECKFCGKTFSCVSNLSKHRRTHTGEKPFVCKVCGKKFASASNLAQHGSVHGGDRPHICVECGKEFAHMGDLRKHVAIHTGDKPFECTQCDKKFIRAGDLRKHNMTHTGERPHECTICGKRFRHGGHLRDHTMIHFKEEKYECKQCGERFVKAMDLKVHCRTHARKNLNLSPNPSMAILQQTLTDAHHAAMMNTMNVLQNTLPLPQTSPIGILHNAQLLKQQTAPVVDGLQDAPIATGSQTLSSEESLGDSEQSQSNIPQISSEASDQTSPMDISQPMPMGSQLNQQRDATPNAQIGSQNLQDIPSQESHMDTHETSQEEGHKNLSMDDTSNPSADCPLDLQMNTKQHPTFEMPQNSHKDPEQNSHQDPEQNPPMEMAHTSTQGESNRNPPGPLLMDKFHMDEETCNASVTSDTEKTWADDVINECMDKLQSENPWINKAYDKAVSAGPSVERTSATSSATKLGKPKRVVDCDICGKTFTNAGNYKQHYRKHTGEKPFECDICGKKFARCNYLNEHKRTHTGEKPHECSECGKKFLSASNLIKHSKLHTGEKPYECDICHKRFTQSTTFKKHALVHTGEKPYACQYCGQDFACSNNLAKHIMIHTGEKPYECNECGKRFLRSTHLEQHKRIHTGERPYKCNECGKGFVCESNLTRHIQSHTGEKPFECKVCHKRFTRGSTLKKHTLLHLGDELYQQSLHGGVTQENPNYEHDGFEVNGEGSKGEDSNFLADEDTSNVDDKDKNHEQSETVADNENERDESEMLKL